MKALIFVCLFLVGLPVVPAGAQGPLATAKSRTIVNKLTAYAQVEPIRTITVRTLINGTITDFRAVPGMAVQKGEVLVRLTGPEYTANVQKAHLREVRARTALNLAKKTFLGMKRTYPDLSTRQQVDKARAAVADARTNLLSSRSRLNYLRQGRLIKAPVDGSVLVTFAGNGEQIQAGDPVARIQPSGELWLRALFYGKDIGLLHTGMQGVFLPAAGGKRIPVTVKTIIEPLRPDGGRGVACIPADNKSAWYNGMAGTLRLKGQTRNWTEVPTTAMILYQGHWWILTHDAGGDHRQAVIPGPVIGNMTLIAKGVKPGQQVVAANAYLRFHRNFSHQYQPPD